MHLSNIRFLLSLILIISIDKATAMNSSPNMLRSIKTLKNNFYALRHGQSMANVAKIISSDPKISTIEHGLSDVGTTQTKNAGEALTQSFSRLNSRGVAIFSSDFRRARETAEIVAQSITDSKIPLYKNDVILETRLRERYFGDFNGGSDSRYNDVWEEDNIDPNHVKFNVESVNSVVSRTTQMVLDIDEELYDAAAGMRGEEAGMIPPNESLKWTCLLVAHGDVLQILQTGFQKIDGSRHRTLPHLETATLRPLELDLSD